MKHLNNDRNIPKESTSRTKNPFKILKDPIKTLQIPQQSQEMPKESTSRTKDPLTIPKDDIKTLKILKESNAELNIP